VSARRAGDAPAPPDAASTRAGRAAAVYATVVIKLRFLIVLGWIAATVAVSMWLPSLSEAQSDGIDGFVPPDLPAINTEVREVRAFGFPLISRTILVQHDPNGLSTFAAAEAGVHAAAMARGDYQDIEPLLGVLPIANTLRLFPSSAQNNTTLLTYFFMPPWVGFASQQQVAQDYVDRFLEPEDDVVGITGSVPARVEQARIVQDSLPLVEGATLLAIVVIVALNFRSLVAPLLTLFTAGLSFLVTLRVAGGLGEALGITVPSELEPLLVALQLGVVTDYVIFYVSGLRRRIAEGDDRLTAAHRATASFTPIVTAAGLTVAAGTAALLVAQSALFRAFGPGMALAVLVGLVVSVTLVPALMAIAGGWLFWPGRSASTSRENAEPDNQASAAYAPNQGPGWVVRLLTRRRSAAVIFLACTAGLVVASIPLGHLGLGLGFVPSLPAGNEVRQAAAAAQAGFAEGILSPTVLLVEGENVTDRRAALSRLDSLLERQEGVAGVFGPGEQILAEEYGVVLSRDGRAARYLLVLDEPPLGAGAVDDLRAIQAQLPELLRAAGLSDVRADFAGDTALATGIVTSTTDDMGRIALAALVVNLLMLVLFLRALVAPLYLLGCSLLALSATLGLTTVVFQDVLGHDGLTFYVPFAAAVLLVALGSDYNIFGVGHIWEEARHRPLREAIEIALPQSTRAITAAGVTLAVSFGLLALVPLRSFRELAFAMAVGILLDAVVVRSMLMPTLLTLFGRTSDWPSRRLHRAATDGGAQPEPSPYAASSSSSNTSS
jgi:RND superfamily putative drug exporter